MKYICIIDCSELKTKLGFYTSELFRFEECLNKEYNLWNKEWPGLNKDEDEFSINKILDFIKNNYNAVVITGSASCAFDEEVPWNSNLRILLKELIDINFPILGLCFGAQGNLFD
jgi:GMP synthase-like glutamine amidotransferase